MDVKYSQSPESGTNVQFVLILTSVRNVRMSAHTTTHSWKLEMWSTPPKKLLPLLRMMKTLLSSMDRESQCLSLKKESNFWVVSLGKDMVKVDDAIDSADSRSIVKSLLKTWKSKQKNSAKKKHKKRWKKRNKKRNQKKSNLQNQRLRLLNKLKTNQLLLRRSNLKKSQRCKIKDNKFSVENNKKLFLLNLPLTFHKSWTKTTEGFTDSLLTILTWQKKKFSWNILKNDLYHLIFNNHLTLKSPKKVY